MPPFQPRAIEHAIFQPAAQALRIGLQHDKQWETHWLPDALRAEGFEVVSSSRAEQFDALVQGNAVDLALLACSPSQVDCIGVLDWLRSRMPEHIPTIMLIPEHDAEHVVQGLEHGADDVLSTGMGQRELVARIKAHAVRCQPVAAAANTLRHGIHSLELQARCMRIGSGPHRQTVRLSSREFSLVLHLFQNLDRVVSKDTLIAQIWGEVDRRFDATLCTYISKLRTSLGLRARNGLVISTVYNQGYRLEHVPIPRNLRAPESRRPAMSMLAYR